MASDRALVALYMRRGGAKYFEIAKELRVSDARARQLVMGALSAQAKTHGSRRPTQAALDSVRTRRVRRSVH